eukprot:COSAG02_NODE_9922_length_2074_cov_1.895190_3_plen_104_part_00
MGFSVENYWSHGGLLVYRDWWWPPFKYLTAVAPGTSLPAGSTTLVTPSATTADGHDNAAFAAFLENRNLARAVMIYFADVTREDRKWAPGQEIFLSYPPSEHA